jgi:hypothetical protein
MRRLFLSLAFVSMLCFLGCGEGDNGVPVHDADVAFYPVDGKDGSPASGQTDSNGNYSLKTNGMDVGCKPGKYKVCITTFSERRKTTTSMADIMAEKFGKGGNAADASKVAAAAKKDLNKQGAVKASLLTPEIYSDQNRTPLSVTVPQGDYNFDLKKDAK